MVSIIFVFLMLFQSVTVQAEIITGSYKDNVYNWYTEDTEPVSCYWRFNDQDNLLTVSGSGVWGNYLQDSSYKNKVVSVSVNSNISVIQDNAFSSLSNLKYVALSSGVVGIGSKAFTGEAKNIILPVSVNAIGENAFPEGSILYCQNQYEMEYCQNAGMNYIVVDAREPLSMRDCMISGIQDKYIYEGESIYPIPVVTYQTGNETLELVRDRDFNVGYSGVSYNGVYGIGDAYLVVSGNGVYQHNQKVPYIVVANLDEDWISLSTNSVSYNGMEQKPAVSVSINGIYLNENEDFDVAYKNNIEEGIASVEVFGKKYIQGSVEKTFEIYRHELTEDCVSLSQNSVSYNGTPREPDVSVSYNGIMLRNGPDYDLEYRNNIDEGVAEVIVTGKNAYKGTIKKAFVIEKEMLSDMDVHMEYDSVSYNGLAQKPHITVSHNGIYLKDKIDYSVEYLNNVFEGIASVVVKGINKFKGIVERVFTIFRIKLVNDDVSISQNSISYNGLEITPNISVSHNGVWLTRGKDYEVEYQDNISAGTAKVAVEGIYNYKGKIVKEFTIMKRDISYDSVILNSISDDGNLEIMVKHKGILLEENTDYSVEIVDDLKQKESEIIVKGINNNCGELRKVIPLRLIDINTAQAMLQYKSVGYSGTMFKPTVSVGWNGSALVKDRDYQIVYENCTMPGKASVKVVGIGRFTGTLNTYFIITPIDISPADVSLNHTIFTYDGSEKKPSVSVILKGKKLTEGQDYYLEYRDNVEDGQAKVRIIAKGVYAGIIEMSFTILPYSSGMDSVYDVGETFIGKNYLYTVSDDVNHEVEFTAPTNKKVKTVVVPATVEVEGVSYKVTSVSNKAFYKNSTITSVTVGNNVKNIEDYAFYGCKNLKTVNLGKHVDKVGNSAFRKCTKLTSVVLPKSIDSIGKNAFYGCSKLTKITINSNKVIDISDGAIKGVSKKVVIRVPKKLVKKYQKKFSKKTGFKKTMSIKKK